MELEPVTKALAALVLPVLWGLLVHGVFSWLDRRSEQQAALATKAPPLSDSHL